MCLDAHSYTVLVSSSCKCNTAEHTATAETNKPTDRVENDERDEGKQVWNGMAIAVRNEVVWITTLFKSIVVTEDPYTTHDNPGKEEEGDQALKRTTATVTTFILIIAIIIPFLFRTQTSSDNVHGCL